MTYALTDVIEELIGRPVPQRGVNAYMRCPLPDHEDGQPSFSINLNTGLWMCWACGEKGGLSKLARLLDGEVDEDNVRVRRALEEVNEHYEEPKDFAELARKYSLRGLIPPPQVVRFLNSRAIDEEAVDHWDIGWDRERQRIVMPYWDDGRVPMLKYRYTDGRRKDKDNEKGGRRAILGIDDIRDGAAIVFICEGESDTYALWSYLNRKGMLDGIAVGGIPGASVTADQWAIWSLDLIWSRRVYIAFDGDEAGDRGADTGIRTLGEKASRLRPPDGMDMAGYLLAGGTLGKLGVGKEALLAELAA